MINYPKRIAVFLCLILIVSLTACDKKQVDYEIDAEVGSLETEPLVNPLEFPDSAKYTVYSAMNEGRLSIDAHILCQPGVRDYPVVRLSEADITPDYMQKMAETFFDDGIFEVDASFQQKYWDGTSAIPESWEVDWYIWNEELPGSWKACYMDGKRNGVPVRMIFYDEGGIRRIEISQPSEYGHQFVEWPDKYEEENECIYTKDQAVMVADEFLEEMGITEFAPCYIYCAEEYTYGDTFDEDERSLNAWSIKYLRSVNGASVLRYSYSDYFDAKMQFEYLTLVVTDQGVMEMFYNMPMQVEEIKTVEASLLSFDDMDRLAQDYLENVFLVRHNLEDVSMEPINEIYLGLAQVEDETGEFYLIPAWYYIIHKSFYSSEFGDYYYDGYYESLIAVFNAIDGSNIEIEEAFPQQ